ncbi:MAG: phosphate ABC transporter permease PstA [Candidatus Cloacimonetes bacterium]|nr:phosphate ABC transporter permease PstA [Candidatus Cloacimonadota bacterium]
MSKRKLTNHLGIGIIILTFLITVVFLIVFILRIFYKGYSVLSWEFLFSSPKEAMTAGGIYPAIVGTFWLTALSIALALPMGIMTAIYLKCFGRPWWFVKTVRIAINTLAGIPSIIYGLFGMAVFVNLLKLDVSLISGALTLAILALPVIINASEEALRQVPNEFREASLALGATERQTILKVLVPTALPNILTGAILAIGRVAGETAPIMFTAATFYTRILPKSLSDEVMALPYHIYALMTEGTNSAKQVPIAYGSALVLMILALAISAIAIYIRFQIRKKRKW